MSAETPAASASSSARLHAAPVCTYFGDGDQQKVFHVSVVIPTIGRPALGDALECVFKQDIPGRIQVLVGFDIGGSVPEFLEPILERRPSNVSVVLLHLPYSTARRHGGPHMAPDGGALRTILSYMANSRYVAYLDDDNRWKPSHLRLLFHAIQGKAYAFAPRMLIDEDTGAVIGRDVWDSVGPNKGRMADRGGFVDPSSLMVDKLAVGTHLGRWSEATVVVEGRYVASDRWFFDGINQMPFGEIDEATVEYKVRSTNVLHRLARGEVLGTAI
jgi:glycosyltransferase involved in cell wall biosynthesis